MMVFEVDAGPLVVNEPDANGRTVSDIIYILPEAEQPEEIASPIDTDVPEG